ncbi:hypothetical protein HGRIS_004108 [Hohenbuehelia grisea]|uniref:BTB domain-containing protein n=1 Tax=Hohenbuehelia grisea TaxID=104357 RepID=A0ABR3JHK8_9AGAR
MADTSPETDAVQEKLPSGLKKSADFWVEGPGTVIFRVDDTLYSLSRASLVDKSPVFAGMFSLPEFESSEGQSVDSPIVLQGFSAEEWEHLIGTCIVVRWCPPPYPPDKWIALLKLSSLYEITNMARRAEYELLGYGDQDLPAPKRMFLARAFNCPSLVDKAFTSLCSNYYRLSTLDDEAINQIGFQCFVILAKTKEKIEKCRKHIANTPPSFGVQAHTGPGCTEPADMQECWRAWKVGWWELMGRAINLPCAYTPPDDHLKLEGRCPEDYGPGSRGATSLSRACHQAYPGDVSL